MGFVELRAAGVVDKMPRLIAVQARNCAPLYDTFRGLPEVEQQPTLAEGIAIARPVRGPQIVQAVRASGGTFLVVTEAEIKASLVEMSRQGFYIEPTSAATTAGVSQYLSQARADECIVSVFTGHGLKKGEKI